LDHLGAGALPFGASDTKYAKNGIAQAGLISAALSSDVVERVGYAMCPRGSKFG